MSGHIEMHVQCRLQRWGTRDGKRVLEEQTTWLPRKFAHAGRILDLQNQITGEWSEGWEVIDASSASALPSDWVRDRTQDYKNMRKMTDI